MNLILNIQPIKEILRHQDLNCCIRNNNGHYLLKKTEEQSNLLEKIFKDKKDQVSLLLMRPELHWKEKELYLSKRKKESELKLLVSENLKFLSETDNLE